MHIEHESVFTLRCSVAEFIAIRHAMFIARDVLVTGELETIRDPSYVERATSFLTMQADKDEMIATLKTLGVIIEETWERVGFDD